MRHYPSIEAYEQSGILGCMLKTLEFLKTPEQTKKQSIPPDPEKSSCSVWVLREGDDDESVTEVLGQPFTELTFDRVSYHPDHERFTCHVAGGGAIVIVPDVYWLDEQWRDWLIDQL
jgi:hypothetical protein